MQKINKKIVPLFARSFNRSDGKWVIGKSVSQSSGQRLIVQCGVYFIKKMMEAYLLDKVIRARPGPGYRNIEEMIHTLLYNCSFTKHMFLHSSLIISKGLKVW